VAVGKLHVGLLTVTSIASPGIIQKFWTRIFNRRAGVGQKIHFSHFSSDLMQKSPFYLLLFNEVNMTSTTNAMTSTTTATQRTEVRIFVKPRSHLAGKVELLDGIYPVSAVFLESIRQQVKAALPTLNPRLAYTLEKLCGKAFWAKLDNGERKLAGRCMAHMVVKNQLPFVFAPSKHEYPKYYQLK